jgi:alpha-maltose-1-phosphate synthase
MPPSELKALLLTREYPPDVYGGAGVHVEHLARELARLIQVEVRTFARQDDLAGGLRVHGYGGAAELSTAAPAHRPALQALEMGIRFAAAPSGAAVVHCHTWYAQFGGLLTKLLYGIPLVVTTHSLEPLRPWKREQLGRGADLAAWTERTALEAADAVIAVSQEMRADIRRHFRVAAERIAVIPNGVDTARYRRVTSRERLLRFAIPPDRPYVLFVGRISRQKGLLHLVRAARQLDPAALLVVCATSPDTPALERKLEEAVGQAGPTRVLWIREMVDTATAVELYSHAAVFCCPSIYEPFGIINLEAMACEVPVVATAVGGIPEVVQDGETGILIRLAQEPAPSFEPQDPAGFSHALADALNRLLADPDRRRSLGRRGRARVEAHFNWQAVARRTVALYTALLAGGPLPDTAARADG